MKQKKHYQVWTEIQQWTEGKYNSQPTKTNVKTISAKSKGSAIVKYIEKLQPGKSGTIKAERVRNYIAGVFLKMYDTSGNILNYNQTLINMPVTKLEPGTTQPSKPNFDKPTGTIGEDVSEDKADWIKANPILLSDQVKAPINKINTEQEFNWGLTGPIGKVGNASTTGKEPNDKQFTTVDEYREKYGESIRDAANLFKINLQRKEPENLDTHIVLTRKQIKTIFEKWITEAETNSTKFRIDPKEYFYSGPERMTQLFVIYVAEILQWPDELTNIVNKEK
jgi:hypothetical protein